MVYQDNVSTIKVLIDVRKKLQILKQEKGLANVSEVILDLMKEKSTIPIKEKSIIKIKEKA